MAEAPMDDDIRSLLLGRGAADIAHPGGTLLAHLDRVAGSLAGWGAEPSIVRAGAAHALYGTDGFDRALATSGERPAMAAVLGAETEQLVYLYGRADRRATYPSIGTSEPVLVDRLGGGPTSLNRLQHSAFAQITYANELDVLANNDALRAAHAPNLRRLFDRWRAVVGPVAAATADRAFDSWG